MSRELAWDGCVNVRDLGGLGQIRSGAVVRMEAPTTLSETGWASALAYGVRTVVDLRSPEEYEREPDLRPAAMTTVRTPLDPLGTPFYDHWLQVDYLASPLYYSPQLAEHPEPVIAAVRAIATATPGCVVFHCAGGKDRTGLLALILLTLTAATPADIIADYLLTFARMKTRPQDFGDRPQLDVITELLAAHGTTIEASLTATITTLSMPDFLLDNGLTEAELTALRTRLTGTA